MSVAGTVCVMPGMGVTPCGMADTLMHALLGGQGSQLVRAPSLQGWPRKLILRGRDGRGSLQWLVASRRRTVSSGWPALELPHPLCSKPGSSKVRAAASSSGWPGPPCAHQGAPSATKGRCMC
jgi:hypothetical protein